MAEATPPTAAEQSPAAPVPSEAGDAEEVGSGAAGSRLVGRAALGRDPIPGPSPAGEAPNDLPEFDQLRDEATKDPVQGPLSWETVARLGERLLRDSSKDFVVASYTGVALAHIDGVAGLRDGLLILDGMLRSFWDTGSPPIPKRMRARASALQWYAEKVAALLERTEFKARDLELVEASLEAAGTLADAIAEKFPPDVEVGIGPILAGLREGSKRLAHDAAASRPRPVAASAASAPRAAAPAASAAPAGAIGEVASRNDAVRAVRAVARFLRQEDPASAEGLALPRLMAWSQLKTAPPSEAGKTMLPPPALRGELENAVAGAPADLLAAAENAFASSPLWLDLQRHTVAALEQLGPQHRVARDFVVTLLRDLVSRVPTLPSLQFSDGSDLADGATRQWLAEEVLADTGGAAFAPAAASAVDPSALAGLRRESLPLVKAGQLGEVKAKLAALFAGDPSPRARFQERLELATLCFEAGRERVALGLLDGLEREIGAHELERWDPGLAARALQALYRAHVKVLGKNPTPEQAARREQLFGRLCQIDPVQAVAVE